MTTAVSGRVRSVIVQRLRAAGCVFAEEEADLIIGAAADREGLWRLVDRRVAGNPLEPLLGWAEFCGIRVRVEAGVFVPRRRTELLVRKAAAVARPAAVVVDLCCGSGAVAVALHALVPDLEVYATDIDPIAVACARRNLPAGQVFAGDLYTALPRRLRGRVDLLTANAPYVPTDAIAYLPAEARLYEPMLALDGGPDGVDLHRRIAAAAPDWLVPGGHLLIETSEVQASATVAACHDAGLTVTVTHCEELEATVAVATKTL